MKTILQILLLKDFNFLGKLVVIIAMCNAVQDSIAQETIAYVVGVCLFVLFVRFTSWCFWEGNKKDGDKHGLY